MATSTQWQLARDSADRYEQVLVPTILGPAARALVDQVGVRPGERVLDVGCGTGAATRYAAERAGASGSIVGVDVNEAMLACAHEKLRDAPSSVELRQVSALALPWSDGEFDVVLCAQTLQFLPEPGAAVVEMRRVLARGGRLSASAWSDMAGSPYFAALVEAVSAHIGEETAAGLGAAFKLAAPGALDELFGGLERVEVRDVEMEVRLPHPRAFVRRHIDATPMAAGYGEASEEARRAVVESMEARMAPYAAEDGIRVPFRTYVVVGVR
jgi:SAM-dependent methyltransferase